MHRRTPPAPPRARLAHVAILAAATTAAACDYRHGEAPRGPAPGAAGSAAAAAPAAAPVELAPDQPLGWIALAPATAARSDPAADATAWLPAGAAAALLPLGDGAPIAPGTALAAIDTAGRAARVAAQAPTTVPYGCDDTPLGVLPLTGDALAPGPVWLLPPAAPASWHPRALPIASPAAAGAATETRRRDTVGPLALELARTAPSRATLTISRDGRALATLPIERAEMEGADLGPLDLREPGVAIPAPVAAWSLADGGPILLVLHAPSFEGEHVAAYLVDRAGARELPALAHYLYRCAF